MTETRTLLTTDNTLTHIVESLVHEFNAALSDGALVMEVKEITIARDAWNTKTTIDQDVFDLNATVQLRVSVPVNKDNV